MFKLPVSRMVHTKPVCPRILPKMWLPKISLFCLQPNLDFFVRKDNESIVCTTDCVVCRKCPLLSRGSYLKIWPVTVSDIFSHCEIWAKPSASASSSSSVSHSISRLSVTCDIKHCRGLDSGLLLGPTLVQETRQTIRSNLNSEGFVISPKRAGQLWVTWASMGEWTSRVRSSVKCSASSAAVGEWTARFNLK